MIAAVMHKDDGSQMVIMVFEPGNIEKLKQGLPIHKFLQEFIPELPHKIELMFAYTPDATWVAEQMERDPLNAERLAEVLAESLTRAPVVVRGHRAEEMKQM